MASPRTPAGLDVGGRDLWKQIAGEHELDAAQRVTLLEVCRCKDRLDLLDGVLCDEDGPRWERALAQANTTANIMKQLIAALRLPDASGKRPQQRGGARGAYAPTAKPSPVSSIDRARSRKSG